MEQSYGVRMRDGEWLCVSISIYLSLYIYLCIYIYVYIYIGLDPISVYLYYLSICAGLPMAFVNKAWSNLTGYVEWICVSISIYLYIYMKAAGLPLAFVNQARTNLPGYVEWICVSISIYLSIIYICLRQQGLDQSYGVRMTDGEWLCVSISIYLSLYIFMYIYLSIHIYRVTPDICLSILFMYVCGAAAGLR